MFSLLCLHVIVDLVVSHFGFEDRNYVLIATVPDQCLSFALLL